MTNFEDKRNELQVERENVSSLGDQLYQSREREKLLRAKITARLVQEGLYYLDDEDPDQQALNELLTVIYEQQTQLAEAESKLEEAEVAFDTLGTSLELFQQLNNDVPVLLLPVRLQTRLVHVKHIVEGISPNQLVDISQYENEDFNALELSDTSREENLFHIPTYFDLKNQDQDTRRIADRIVQHVRKKEGELPSSWLKIVPDSHELWLRIYPDDIAVHGHEKLLSADEIRAGKAFWERWCEIHKEDRNALEKELRKDRVAKDKPLTAAWAEIQKSYSHGRASWIVKTTKPEDLPEEGASYSSYTPTFDGLDTKLKSDIWTQPLSSKVLPDRFVAHVEIEGQTEAQTFEGNRIPHPLQLSPSPENNGHLDEVKWMKDFAEAERIGMAIRIPLSGRGEINIERIAVLGVKTSSSSMESKELVEDLLENHRHQGTGMSILPQGTPTNNFEHTASGFSERGMPVEEAFKLEFDDPLFGGEASWKTRKDGWYLANALGVQHKSLKRIYKADSMDIGQGMAMNRLLWAATLAYYLQQFFQQAVSKGDRAKVRDFFVDFVLGSGMLPVLRVGKQPYGIVPATNFQKWTYTKSGDAFYKNLLGKVLRPLDTYWTSRIDDVRTIGSPLSTGESLNGEKLDPFSSEFVQILGLSASSQSFYRRPVMSMELINQLDPGNEINYLDRQKILDALDEMRLPFEGQVKDRAFALHLSNLMQEVSLPLVDIRPSSEHLFLPQLPSPYSDGDGNTLHYNYLEWLQQANYLQLQSDLFDPASSEESVYNTLLFQLARQAIARNYLEIAAHHIDKDNDLISTIDFSLDHLFPIDKELKRSDRMLKEEVRAFLEGVEGNSNNLDNLLFERNKWEYLNYKITAKKNSQEPAGEFPIGEIIDVKQKTSQAEVWRPLKDAKQALDCLKDVSTAGLERLLSSHLDLCNYRLDAWMLGLINQRLWEIREKEGDHPKGLHLGAYGYLENLSLNLNEETDFVYRKIDAPEFEENPGIVAKNELVIPFIDLKSLMEDGWDAYAYSSNAIMYLGEERVGDFQRAFDDPEKIVHQISPAKDTGNQGFIHSPSQAHATTAAILRSAYLAHHTDEATDEFAINLSSARVRKALFYIEGMRNGNDLPALLGYQFERMLHDHPEAGLNAYLWDFRKNFPYSAEIEGEKATPDNNRDKYQTINGLRLLNFYRSVREPKIDNLKIGVKNQEHKEILRELIEQLAQHLDAISDLLSAESIFQVAKGDLDKASATLKMLSNDKEVGVPEIVGTPTGGKPLSHLVGVQFDFEKEELDWDRFNTPRSLMNPGLNRWLIKQLPYSGDVITNVEINGGRRRVSLRNLYLQPIDLIAFFRGKDPLSENSALYFHIKEEALRRYLQAHEFEVYDPERDGKVSVLYEDKTGFRSGEINLPELQPLLVKLATVIENSRPVFPADLVPPSKSRPLEKEGYNQIDNSYLIDKLEYLIRNSYKRVNPANIPKSLTDIYHLIESKTESLIEMRDKDYSDSEIEKEFLIVQKTLHAAAYLAPLKEDYFPSQTFSPANADALIEKGKRAAAYYYVLRTQARSLFTQAKAIEDKKAQWEALVEICKLIFGDTLMLCPHFRFANTEEFQAALDFPDLMEEAPEDAQKDWLQGLSLVRDNIKGYLRYREEKNFYKLKYPERDLKILQLPYQARHENYRWLGTSFPPNIEIKGTHLSLALELQENFNPDDLQSGMIIDQWTERIQTANQETAFALHYDQANSEPPQSMLLCVSPTDTPGTWEWEDLLQSVIGTMEMAKKRALDPSLWEARAGSVDEAPDHAHYMSGIPLKFMLPGIVLPVSQSSNTPSLNFDTENNHF